MDGAEFILWFLIVYVIVVVPTISLLRRISKERKKELRREREGPPSICGCEHHFSFHDETGCHQKVKTPTKWEREKDPLGDMKPVHWEFPECPCVKYIGPEPLPEVFHPRLLEGPPE